MGGLDGHKAPLVLLSLQSMIQCFVRWWWVHEKSWQVELEEGYGHLAPLVVLKVHPMKQSCVRWWLAHPKRWKSLNWGLGLVRLTAVVAGLWQPKGPMILPLWDCHGRGVFILHNKVLLCLISPFTLCLCLLDCGVGSLVFVLVSLLFLNILFLYRFLVALSRCLIFSRGRRKLIGVDEEW